MSERIVRHLLDMMQVHKVETTWRQRAVRNLIVAIPFVVAIADEDRWRGITLLFAFFAIGPFLIGMYWKTRVITDRDRDQLRRKIGRREYWPSVFSLLVVTWIMRLPRTHKEPLPEFIVWSTAFAIGCPLLLIYLPFALGKRWRRYLDRRQSVRPTDLP